MRIALSREPACWVALLAVSLAATACGSGTDLPRAEAKPPATPPAASSPAAEKASPPAEHEHKAPHGGALIELGEEFAHLELVVNRTTGVVTAYVLDGEAEQAVRLAQPALEIHVTPPAGPALTIALKPVANELTGERAGDTSQYASTTPDVAKLARFDGRVVRVAVRGREFADVAFTWPEGTER